MKFIEKKERLTILHEKKLTISNIIRYRHKEREKIRLINDWNENKRKEIKCVHVQNMLE
jgi:hypothetical protein